MAENPALLAAVLAAPYADAPRLAYADWLDQQRDARGMFIRLQIALTRPPAVAAGGSADPVLLKVQRMEDEERERTLRRRNGDAWAAPVASLVTDYVFDRGFVAGVTLPAVDFLAHAGQLFRLAPIVHVRLTGARPVMDALCASPLLAHVRALSLDGNGLTRDDLVPLTQSPYLTNLWWLDLRWNDIDFEGAKLLAGTPHFRRLAYLGLAGNPCDPMETVGLEGYAILDARLPEEGEALEALYGYIPWLHYPSDSVADYPPNPLRAPLNP